MQKVTVRFVDARDDYVIETDEISIEEIKERIINNYPDVRDKFLRIIQRGKILNNSVVINSDTVLHCSISDEESNQSSAEQDARRVGFDRLLEMGLEENEVLELRQQFHTLRGVNVLETPNLATQAEEQWIENAGNESVEVSESQVDLLMGLVLGYFAGIIIIFWLKEANIFSRRQQQGIISGIVINVFFGILRWF
ncbi:hypothetical protein HK103_000149 [Boothiomyces macroporosus]|uniref:DSC E3 ubiquitin ligase complex subunit 3 C-terminal domain-containing protein n=1 Tax=Boothiomyces macroporosus TaxID=261099 RepID=A0AAD5UMY7_9FUNG|nr:hypothetical protein HK103_000149 [Boothiomyces macroporosus]